MEQWHKVIEKGMANNIPMKRKKIYRKNKYQVQV